MSAEPTQAKREAHACGSTGTLLDLALGHDTTTSLLPCDLLLLRLQRVVDEERNGSDVNCLVLFGCQRQRAEGKDPSN